MKKTYLQPETYIEVLNIESNILIPVSNSEVEGNNGGWVKKDNDWDIWGSEGDEE